MLIANPSDSMKHISAWQKQAQHPYENYLGSPQGYGYS